MKKILKLTFILFLVCAITAGVLGLINEMTYDRIQEQKRIKTEKAYAAVLASDGYEETAFDKAAFPTIDKVNKCTNGAGLCGHHHFLRRPGQDHHGCRR